MMQDWADYLDVLKTSAKPTISPLATDTMLRNNQPQEEFCNNIQDQEAI